MSAVRIAKPTPQQQALAVVNRLARELTAADLEAAKARGRLNAAIMSALPHASMTQVANAAGISRQRVAQLRDAAKGRA